MNIISHTYAVVRNFARIPRVFKGISGLLLPVLAAGFVGLSFATVEAQTPLLDYRFDETGTTASSSVAATNSTLTFQNYGSTTPVDLHSASGTGVSGQEGDRAFDNSASVKMGGNGGAGIASGTVSALNNLTSFTITGWAKDATEVSGDSARIFRIPGFMDLSMVSNGRLQLSLGAGGAGNAAINVVPSGTGPYTFTSSEWTFFAISVDLTADTVTFYWGDTTTTVTQAGSIIMTLSTPTSTGTAANPLYVGNADSSKNRAFDGWLDDLAIYGTTSGSSGALSQPQLEAIRLSAIPEPTTFVLFIGGLAVLLYRGRRQVSQAL